ncbi:hypothetical protein LJC74_03670 [Eubacteriales bacterium OttesenSCG-928-A19]|nr:hypothetical protein [Eubacteriales bacterium OttesenSCG-928-A19]
MATTYSVYVQVDGRGNIIYINSDYYLEDTGGLILIDKGTTVKYRDAQDKYLDGGLYGTNGRVQTPNYKLVDGAVVARTDAEKDRDPYSDEPDPETPGSADEAMDIIEGRAE